MSQVISIFGTPMDDVLDGTGARELIHGLAGDDRLRGNGGDDLFGGTGSDVYVFGTGFGATLVVEAFGISDEILLSNFRPGEIRLNGSWDGDSLRIIVDGTADVVTISGGLGEDHRYTVETLRFKSGATMDLTGGLTMAGDDNDDLFSGTRFDDIIEGHRGNDRLRGQAGDDRIQAGGGNDIVFGDANGAGNPATDGDDRIFLGRGNDIGKGGGGRDSIFGGDGNDTLFGGAGDDRLKGGDDGDTLIGGAGDDVLTGGAGSDVFVFLDDGSRDVVRDFKSGRDLLDFTDFGLTVFDVLFEDINDRRDLLIYAEDARIVLRGVSLSDISPLDDMVF